MILLRTHRASLLASSVAAVSSVVFIKHRTDHAQQRRNSTVLDAALQLPVCDSTRMQQIQRWRRRWQDAQLRFGFDPRLPERKSVIVLGTGWGAMNFVRYLDVTRYDVTIVSPRNFFTFTPLLPSVCAGTLSPRSCLEPVRPALRRGGCQVMNFYEGWATTIDPTKNKVECQSKDGTRFSLPYDYLVVAVGAETNTFGVPGVSENATFLKEVENAREIRRRVLSNFERASLPGLTLDMKKRLLHFVIVGGGPTGVETAAELSDFIREDARRYFPDLTGWAKISLVEMLPRLLPICNPTVSEYTHTNLLRQGVDVLLQNRVVKVTPQSICVEDKDKTTKELPCAFVLWASGVGQVPFTKKLLQTIPSQQQNRVLQVDDRLRVRGVAPPSLYGIGDCVMVAPDPLTCYADVLYDAAVATSETGAGKTWLKANQERLGFRFPQLDSVSLGTPSHGKQDHLTREEFKGLLQNIDANYKPPPPTAQNANQAGRYLATIFNHYISDTDKGKAPAYMYRWRGSLAYVGDGHSVLELPRKTHLGGPLTLLFWKAFYLSEQISTTNKLICLFDWVRTRLVGRDVGRDHTRDGVPAPPPSAALT